MKRGYISALVVLLALFLYSGTVFSQEQGKSEKDSLRVQEFAFCKSVKDHEPVGVSTEFPSDIGRVYLWTSIYSVEQQTEIKHIWYYGVKKMREIPLSIQYQRTRTWSYKNILPQWAGDWHVDVVDEQGKVLKKLSFKIIE